MYPYPAIASLLKTLCTPEQYLSLISKKPYMRTPDYWAILPWYTYAYCPFCGKKYHEPADTYYIKMWQQSRPETKLFSASGSPVEPPCIHLLGVREFANFHNVDPTDINYFDNKNSEVPYMNTNFFDPKIRAYVVLHALPICAIKDNQFVPTYTAFIMTYFSEDPKAIIKRQYAVQEPLVEVDPEYWPTLTGHPPMVGPGYDLAQWAADGILGYLDISDPELPLRIGKGSSLPEFYRSIEGRRRPFLWRRNAVGVVSRTPP